MGNRGYPRFVDQDLSLDTGVDTSRRERQPQSPLPQDRRASGIEGDGYVEFEMDNTKFSLFERSKLPELIGREGGNPPCGEIGFLIEDVDGEAERLRGLDVEILSGPMDRPWHERTLHIADPDGNIIEFAQKLR